MKTLKTLILLCFIATSAFAADIKVPQLPAASSVVPSNLLMVDQGNTSRKATAKQVAEGGMGYAASTTATPNKLVVRDGSGKVPGDITGNADTLDGLHATAFATASQGAKADTALQDPSAFATAAQGGKADSALQDPTPFLIPPGAVMAFVGVTCPTGWIAANGDPMNAGISAPLYALTGATLPDLRGEFIRGWSNGRALVDVGRGAGTYRLDALQNITGQFIADDSVLSGLSGALYDSGTRLATGSDNNGASVLVKFDASHSPGARTDTETYPRNIALLYCIKK